MPSTRDLLRSLMSTICPACGNVKATRQTLCRKDYYALPPQTRKALYQRVGEGYEEAIAQAFDALKVIVPHLPD